MAISDIDNLRTNLPDLFHDRVMPPNWDDLIFIPINDPEIEPQAESQNDQSFESYLWASSDSDPEGAFKPDWAPPHELIEALSGVNGHAGSLVVPKEAIVPPPDALAFYLPFHYFYPIWWGIYLTTEGTQWLANFILAHGGGNLSGREATHVARVFLYSHEAFHHKTEMFATRMEQVQRRKLYRTSFERLFQATIGTDDCLEEALATAEAYIRVKHLCLQYDDYKLYSALTALDEYIKKLPPGYRIAMDYGTRTKFTRGRCKFAETNYRNSFPSRPRCDFSVWKTFPNAFGPMSRVNSRVNYVISRDSSIASRAGLGLRYLSYKQLTKRLRKLSGCRPTGKGEGSHEIWICPAGGKFPIPRHTRDLATGTLMKIIRAAGLDLSVTQFISMDV